MSNPETMNAAHVDRKVGDLTVDPNVQRAMKKARVDKMAADFHPEALGVLTTSLRADGLICIVDGQHRYRAAEAANYTGVLKTLEYRGLTLQQEAALFRMLNTSEKPTPIDQFIVACVEGRPDALFLSNVLSTNGWTVANSAGNGRVSAIRSLERVYALNPQAAAATMAVLTTAYGRVPAAVQGSMIEGLGRMLARYWDQQIDLTDLAQRLSRSPGGPDALVGFARGQRLAGVGSLAIQVAREITRIYNQRRKTTKLPDWS